MDFVKVEVDVNSQPIKVPKLKLSFSGNAKDWLGFAHLLKSMLSTNPMSVEEKFLLLMNALPDFLKKDLPMVPSEANYQWIMDHLSQKFGDERDLGNDVLSELERLEFGYNSSIGLVAEKITLLYARVINTKIPFEVHLNLTDSVLKPKFCGIIISYCRNRLFREYLFFFEINVMNCSDIYTMIIGGQIPGRTIEQNLTSEAREVLRGPAATCAAIFFFERYQKFCSLYLDMRSDISIGCAAIWFVENQLIPCSFFLLMVTSANAANGVSWITAYQMWMTTLIDRSPEWIAQRPNNDMVPDQ
ncbi:hypothetical protein DERF_008188 [Dermatophagoides farinae]|uniref:Uncharacterized protein n=1 Tax=Dermatophagoides farinae TaxID=6954 RepID=A0A922I1X1_DERFA|nr:hypothetical protein DERF_008188 [Dermatophagoides farinae]